MLFFLQCIHSIAMFLTIIKLSFIFFSTWQYKYTLAMVLIIWIKVSLIVISSIIHQSIYILLKLKLAFIFHPIIHKDAKNYNLILSIHKHTFTIWSPISKFTIVSETIRMIEHSVTMQEPIFKLSSTFSIFTLQKSISV